MSRIIVPVLSDTHGGFSLGLLSPDVTLYDESEDGDLVSYKPKLTSSQNYLWALYTKCIEKVKEIAGEDEIILIHNGDLTHGNKHPSLLVSNRISDQILIGIENLKPWYSLPSLSSVRIMIGTAAHNFGEGSSEILACKNLFDQFHVDTKISYHSSISIRGCGLDVAHHGPYPGSREWLKGNVARYYLRDIVMRELIAGNVPPRVVLRAHYHQYVREDLHQAGKTSTLIVTPSFCMLGDYAHQAARSPDRITNGMIVLEIIDGELVKIHELMETSDIRTKEVL